MDVREMKPMRVMLAGLLALLVLMGCTCSVGNQGMQTMMGTHAVTVMPGSSVVSSSNITSNGKTTYEYTCGATTVRIADDKLVVNNMSYGKLTPTARIDIDSGVVSVNGRVVRGRPLTQRERRQSSNFEATATLDGHQVTVRPGAMMQSTTNIMDRHTLTVGESTVVIENDNLTVNDVDYGSLNAGDKIIVDEGKVKVNGRVRRPAAAAGPEEEGK